MVAKEREASVKEVERLRSIEDPMEQLQYSGEVLATLQAITVEVGEIRRGAVDALRGQGMTLAQISAEAGISIARLSQLGAPRRRPERLLLSSGDTVHVVLPVEQAPYPEGPQRPVVHESDIAFRKDIESLAREYGLATETEHLPAGEYVDLNRDGLVVTCGPRQSPWLTQILASDSSYGFERDDESWYLLDKTSGDKLRSPHHTGEKGDLAYLGTLPRPDGNGTWLYCAGIHAPGSRGGALYLAEHIAELYRETRGHLWSCLVRCDYDPDSQEVSNAELIAPVRRRERLRQQR
ncbi:hypothetical protein FB561_2764 [Kribbella amoyensis]|uniref:Sigma-70-like protein n=1 Tax=Kribbella amoyensis TaxID=996641 RepID=A0A561BRX4_9ACTN|nr:sigma-70 family RNA polymerase sigma factor [Kribbella amoyensis]TWD81644.1 hypothetical protein FB561_2764 [Kribbella amoyensis]